MVHVIELLSKSRPYAKPWPRSLGANFLMNGLWSPFLDLGKGSTHEMLKCKHV